MRPSSRRAIATPGRQASYKYWNRATFIEGGLIFTFVAQHATMDFIGQGHFIRLFDKAAKKKFTVEELTAGNVARHEIAPLLDDPYEPGAEVARQIIAARPTPDTASTIILGSLRVRIHRARGSQIPRHESPQTTNDALTPFVWRSSALARLLRLSPTTTLTFGRAIDPRSYLDLPPPPAPASCRI
ncbi:hypothetical protein PLEOSDRAFT_163375 [Pleurotus ostreatus PC15]|uniref:Trichothecene 3-O-acetyltransferase-like N-terminal domain-containing protein n=1 Tax=Pleurotus ostreatus (strain PC15) TaxID=1137138 RepID=A0A067N385_PLEO1|nr:hypothetical protein PLEOSDRAFT_163375 [Pleurotus ostreatus PC15]